LVLGEAAKRLSSEFRSRHHDVPWSDMAGMRDKLIHAYEAVDYDEVWSTATKDIPELLTWVTPLLPGADLRHMESSKWDAQLLRAEHGNGRCEDQVVRVEPQDAHQSRKAREVAGDDSLQVRHPALTPGVEPLGRE